MAKDIFLVTGASGCIGSWVLKNLIKDGVPAIGSDLVDDFTRCEAILSEAEREKLKFIKLDVTNSGDIIKAVEENKITHIIHLAGVMTPACKSNPLQGANVNILGTIGVFEAARKLKGQIVGLSYASSIAVFGPSEIYENFPLEDSAAPKPDTLYGVYKLANEAVARIYWQDWGIGSIGLRPYTVYGPGRDLGLTSSITLAILAAVMNRPYHIGFGGVVGLIYADDVARIFIESAKKNVKGAAACNIRHDVIQVEEFVKMLKSEIPGCEITYSAMEDLPFPAETTDKGLRQMIGSFPRTPLLKGLRKSISTFEELLKGGHAYLKKIEADRFL